MGSAANKNKTSKYSQLSFQSSSKIKNEASFDSNPPLKIEGDRLDSQPHKSIGAILMGDSGKGTGVLISKNLVLTVAHNIYSQQQQKEYSNIRFFLAPKGTIKKADGNHIQQWRYPTQYKNNVRQDSVIYDYALLKLAHLSYKPHFEYLPLTVACPQCNNQINENSNISLFGYPVQLRGLRNYKQIDNNPDQLSVTQLGYSSINPDMIYSAQGKCITHTINTQEGQSGSPIICGGKYVGLHKGSVKGDNPQENEFRCNIGRLITLDMLLNLLEWRREMEADSFKFQICEHIKAKINLPITKQKYQNYQLLVNPISQTIVFTSKNIQQINIKPCLNLTKLNLSENLLKNINIASNRLLEQLNLSQNYLQDIDLSNNTHLQIIKIDNNGLKLLDLNRCPHLKILHASYNCLSKVDLTSNINLMELLLDNNHISQLVFFYNSNTFWKQNIGMQKKTKQVKVQIFYQSNQLNRIKQFKEDLAVKYWDEQNCTYIVKALKL